MTHVRGSRLLSRMGKRSLLRCPPPTNKMTAFSLTHPRCLGLLLLQEPLPVTRLFWGRESLLTLHDGGHFPFPELMLNKAHPRAQSHPLPCKPQPAKCLRGDKRLVSLSWVPGTSRGGLGG